jgi:hypothetical protein
MPCISLDQQIKEEKLHLIQLDWSSKSDAWIIEYGEEKLSDQFGFGTILYEFAKKNEADFRRYLEDTYNLEQKYIDEKWEND